MSGLRKFVGRKRLYLQSMNRMGEQVLDPAEDLLVTLETGNAGKGLRHDQQGKVPGATGCSGVARVFGAVVMDFKRGRREVGKA